MMRTISVEQRDASNADVAQQMLRTKSIEGQKHQQQFYANQVAAASTAALSSSSYASSVGTVRVASKDVNNVTIAPKNVTYAVSEKIGKENENFAMMAEEQLVMDRCEFLNNGCSDFGATPLLRKPAVSPTTSQAVTDTYATWVKSVDSAMKEATAGLVPDVPVNNDFGPLLLTKEQINDNVKDYQKGKSAELDRLYGIEEGRQGRLYNLAGKGGFVSQLSDFERIAKETDMKLVLEEMDICSRFDVLNNGCSYGAPDTLTDVRLAKEDQDIASLVKCAELDRLYGIEEDRQGRLYNLAGKGGFVSQLSDFERIAKETDMKLVLEEMNICSRFDVLNNGCSYGAEDTLTDVQCPRLAQEDQDIASRHSVLNNGCSYGGRDQLNNCEHMLATK